MKARLPLLRKFNFIFFGALILIASSCKDKEQKAPPPPEIKVVKVIHKDTPIY
jgi:hypothetical protein